MDFTKETFNNKKAKAEERITDWIETCQTAGVTRLYDQYGNTRFKKIKNKKGDEQLTKSKTSVPSRLKPLKQNDKTQKKHSETGGGNDTRKRDKGKLLTRQDGEGSRSRLTSDSTRKYQDSAAKFREMNNRSSHNRSAFRDSVCNMDVLSLMCDDPNDKQIEEYYMSSKYDHDYDLSYFNISETTKSKKDQWKESNKKMAKSTFPNRFQNEKSSLSTVDRAEKTFYKSDKIEKFKPRIIKKNRIKDDNKGQLKKLQVHRECISGEKNSATDLYDYSQPLHALPATSRQIKTVVDDSSCFPPIQIDLPETSVQSNRAPSNLYIPITFTIDTAKIKSSSDVMTRAETSAGWSAPPMLQLDPRPSKSEISQPQPTRLVANHLPLAAVKKSKSRLSRINLSKTPSMVIQPDKSNIALRSASKKCLSGLPSSTNPAADKRKQRLERFRRFTKKYINVSRMLNAVKAKMKIQTKEELISMNNAAQAKKSNVLDFDVSYFKSATTSYGGLTQRARDALSKKVHQRTERDMQTLNEVMDRLPFFHKYPQATKSKLAKSIWYDQFEDKRVIIKQGDIGTRMYFVVSGCVSMKSTEIDPRTGLKHVVHLKDVQPGSTFGELALIRDVKRTYTAMCKGDSEFLSLSKDDFNNVLREKWEQDWQDRQQFIEDLPCFHDATVEQIKNATDLSEIVSFPANKIIFGNKKKMAEFVYFIKKGKCEMIRNVSLVRTQSPYLRPSLFLSEMMKDSDSSKFMDKPYGKKTRICRKENHLLTVMSLHPGDVFGVGENLQDTFILTKNKVECLLINSAFFAINLMSDRLEMKREQIEEKVPSNIELYRKFEANRKWTEYKKNLVEKVVKKNGAPNVTTKTDIPKILLMEPTIPDDLIWTKRDK